MDIFRFMNPVHPTLFDQGVLINNIKSKLWIERYREAGEFELIGDASENLHVQLPIGSFISHINSTEVMIVENHEINEQKGKETKVKITGRSFESFLENRIVGSNKEWPTEASANDDYLLEEEYSWNQVVSLIKNHIDPSMVIDSGDALYHVDVVTDILSEGEIVERVIRRGSLYSSIIELLSVDNLGIKIIRPGPNALFGFDTTNLTMVIHMGKDLSKEVVFSHEAAEIDNSDYLWSNKTVKNAALVTSRWFQTVVKNTETGYNRRMMEVDASDLDSGYNEPPEDPIRSQILFWMFIRGHSALLSQKKVALIKTEPVKESTTYRYRRDYQVGDIITVSGRYNETSTMQISEHVEIEDETGQRSYPTFSNV